MNIERAPEACWPVPADDGLDLENYGRVDVIVGADGRLHFLRTDRIAGISASLFTDDDVGFDIWNGCIVVDGRHVYVPVAFADRGRVVVCELMRLLAGAEAHWGQGLSVGT